MYCRTKGNIYVSILYTHICIYVCILKRQKLSTFHFQNPNHNKFGYYIWTPPPLLRIPPSHFLLPSSIINPPPVPPPPAERVCFLKHSNPHSHTRVACPIFIVFTRSVTKHSERKSFFLNANNHGMYWPVDIKKILVYTSWRSMLKKMIVHHTIFWLKFSNWKF
jgi:hypothetical protein